MQADMGYCVNASFSSFHSEGAPCWSWVISTEIGAKWSENASSVLAVRGHREIHRRWMEKIITGEQMFQRPHFYLGNCPQVNFKTWNTYLPPFPHEFEALLEDALAQDLNGCKQPGLQ